MQPDFKRIINQFQIHGDPLGAEPYGSGHINDTYAATVDQGGTPVRYIMQRINYQVFRNPPALMENIQRVTTHSRAKLMERGLDHVSRQALTVIPARDGLPYARDDQGNYWRVYIFIEKAATYDTLTKIDQAYEAARAFGDFQKTLVDLPGEPLHETIPDFHNGRVRYRSFLDALESDVANRASDAKEEITFLTSQESVFDVLPDLVERGELPVRVTHNDTKINNVMLDDATGKGVCVIDLDTVMPGLVLYDFGDMVRTSTSPAAEDERDLSKVEMRLDRFEALVRGYLSTAGEFLNPAEIENLAFAGKLITLIIGTRFLTDYLLGDPYFKVHREGHNLDRCRTQFQLVRSIIEREDRARNIVENTRAEVKS